MIKGKKSLENLLVNNLNTKNNLEEIMVSKDEGLNMKEILDSMDQKELDQYMSQLEMAQSKYERHRPLKWAVTLVFLIIGLLIANFLPPAINFLFGARYNRYKLEKLMYDKLGAAGINDVLTDEIIIVAYDYNSQEPRFYSKFFA